MSIISGYCRCKTLLHNFNYKESVLKYFGILRSDFAVLRRSFSSESILNVNTNVVKDVVLYRNDNTRKLKLMNYCALGQFVFWNYLAQTAFTTLKDVPVVIDSNENVAWYERFNLGANSMRFSLTGLCLILGNGLLAVAYIYTTRAVKLIVLKKGGQHIDLVTQTPFFGKDRVVNLPVNQVSASENRQNARVTIPLQVQGKSFYYLIDMYGKFGNGRLFDATVGLRRKLKPK